MNFELLGIGLQRLAQVTANDRRPAAAVGDRVPHRLRWLDAVEYGHPRRYEVSCSRCPDCGANFVATMAVVNPADSLARRRGRTHSRRRRRSRCSPCQAERERLLKNEQNRRYRAKQATPAPQQSCLHCQALFTPRRSTARYCCMKCRVAAHRGRSQPA